MTALLSLVADAFTQWRRAGLSLPCVLGISGAQGSGKSTLAQQMVDHLQRLGLRAAPLSLDDLYLPWSDRLALSRKVHPLLKTRGVPGTHDVEHGLRLIKAFRDGQPFTIPRFDKSTDDVHPNALWPRIDRPLDVLVFEGWCLGAMEETPRELLIPLNALEREDDASAQWRTYVNQQLATDYQRLFRMIDRLVFLRAPSWTVVADWRAQQEATLSVSSQGRAMTQQEIAHFVQYFERITRSCHRKLPFQADLTIELDAERRSVRILPNDLGVK